METDVKDIVKAFFEPVLNACIKNNEKEEEKEIKNEKTDKRKLIDEVAGMMKSAGCDDEVIRTAIGKMEKIGYDESEAGTADNKKVKNEDKKEDKKEDVKNKKVKNEDEGDEEKVKDLKEDLEEDIKNKKVKNEDEGDEEKVKDLKEDLEEDIKNKKSCKNSVENSTDYFEKLNAIYNSTSAAKTQKTLLTREDRLEDGKRF